jgi:hypothetical protein
MSNEINAPFSSLDKAIAQAEKNGWDFARWLLDETKDPYGWWHTYGLIFNHDFAKALWGERKEVASDGLYDVRGCQGQVSGATYENYEDWQYHLQQMVIADDPIAYLGEHL